MLAAKQMEIRSNIKKYFDMAFQGEVIIVPRKEARNVVIISEAEYNRLHQLERVMTYSDGLSKHGISKNSDGSVRAHNLEKLESIRRLKPGWNGNGAPAFPDSLLSKVEQIINGLSIQPEIFPTALCTIQMEFDNSRRDHMEIEIGEGDVCEVFTIDYAGSSHTEIISSYLEDITRKVEDFYG